MPAYSMGKASRQSIAKKNQTPGVGAYQTNSWQKVSRIKTAPSNSMPKTKKFFNIMEKLEDKIGPGRYNPEKSQTKLMASLKGKTSYQFVQQTPSPANYNANYQLKYSHTKYSFGRSVRKLKTQSGPGPTRYTVHEPSSQASINFGKQQRNKSIDNKVPGPGFYDYKPPEVSKSFQQYSFPKQKKFITQQVQQKIKSKIPGPGAYCLSSYKKLYKGGKFGCGSRVSTTQNDIPGPGVYNPKVSSQKRNPHATIGHQKRDKNYSTDTPGPGNYQVIKPEVFQKKDGVAVFSQGQRIKYPDKKTPGPGQYNTVQLDKSRAHSITARPTYTKVQKTPGPQTYKPQFDTIQKKQGCPVFGSEQRLSSYNTITPGPGTYKLSAQKLNKTFYFNRAANREKAGSTVGPGQYKLKPYIGVYDGSTKDNKQILYV